MNRFLERIRIGQYGAFSDYDVGPFKPGLNVVYGPNEAGKSTIASFVGGVLFGWEEARGVRNTYRPQEGHRSGSLVFRDAAAEGPADDGGQASVVSRGHNADGLLGDVGIVSDIDHATYRTMFYLTSEELRSLRNTSDVTARLLTAGAGTGSSPTSAFVEIEQRIAAYASPADASPQSLQLLGNRLEEKREEVAAAAAQVELNKQEDRERAELAESRTAASARLEELNAELEALHGARAKLESVDVRTAAKREELEALVAEKRSFETAGEAAPQVDERLLDLDAPGDRLLRDRLDEFASEQAKIERSIDLAKENSAASTAAYDALLEVEEEPMSRARDLRNRSWQVVVSVLLPIAFIAGGIPVFVHGRQIQSLSFTALGIGMVVLAFFLAAAALVVLFRPNRSQEALGDRRKDAQWVMLQDRKKLDASLAEAEGLRERVNAFLEENGLQGANGSIRQARALLDDARDARARLADAQQRTTSVDMRIAAARDALDALADERRETASAVGLGEDASVQQLDALIRKQSEQRDAISRAYEDMNLRYGELGERLEHARQDRTFDRLKLEYQQLLCELRDRKHELVTLMLAKRMLEKSIVAWESRSQPEVYAQASKLLELITGGAWVRISMSAEGLLTAVSATGEPRDVRHLSLGTCQQLYLSLRMAMLMHARDVGRAVPVIADDMLVHFDAERRGNAALALAQLADVRQVIVFTCHRETVDALRAACPDLNYLAL